MRKAKLYLVSIVACLVLAVSGFADHRLGHRPPGGGRGGGGDGEDGRIPVTVTFRDCTDGVPANGFDCPSADSDDGIKSDGRPYTDREEKVTAAISGLGHFFMKMGRKQALRTLSLDFSDCALEDDSKCTPPHEFSAQAVRLDLLQTRGINLSGMLEDETEDELRLKLTFLAEGISGFWQLFFDPLDMDCPGSHVSVTRTGVDTWVIEAEQTDVACLVRFDGIGGELSGEYHMPFQVTVVRKP